jgi:uncharacterized membrane protein YfcA
MWIVLFLAGIWAGAQNALAGGGSFVTLPTLVLSGLDARAANITSTIALFPGQVTTGLAGRAMASGVQKLSFPILLLISLAGGVLGALLLIYTPPEFFGRLVPWLVLFATLVFVWGSLRKAPSAGSNIGPMATAAMQFLISIYGGYFGGGIGFLMLAALTFAGLDVRSAGATKNILAAAMNASAVLIFIFSRDVHWLQAAILGVGAMLGGLLGAWILKRVDTRLLRTGVILLGFLLTAGLFWRAR